MSLRFGNDERGTGPWTRYELVKDFEYRMWEWRMADAGHDYLMLWNNGSRAWHGSMGIASKIVDSTGETVFIFD